MRPIRLAAILPALALAVAASPARADEPAVEAASPAALAIGDDHPAAAARRAFLAGDFPALEEQAAALRASRRRLDDGSWAITAFYSGFSPSLLNLTDAAAREKFAAWREASPNSATRVAAEGAYWRAASAATSNIELRRARRTARYAALKNSVPDADCPQLAAERHLLLTSREQDRASAESLLANGSRAWPGYIPLLEAHAGWLNGFAPDEIAPWLATEADRIGGPDGDELYALVALSRPRAGDWITELAFDWPRIRRGLESVHRRWPEAEGPLDRLVVAALSHHDHETVRDTLRRIETPHRPAWSDNLGEYLRARRVAGLEPASDLRPARELDLDLRGYRVAVSPDSRTVVVGCARGEILAFSATDCGPLRRLECPRWVSSLAFSPDGRLLCATGGNVHDRAGEGGGAWVWDVASGELLASDNSLPKRLVASAFSPDGRTLWLAGGAGKTGLVLRWSPGDAAFTRVELPAGFGAIKSVAAANDAAYFSASRKIWRIPSDQDAASAPVVIHAGEAINTIALSPDGRDLVLGDWLANSAWEEPARLRRLDLFPVATSPEPVEPVALDSAGLLQGTRIEAVSFARSGLLAAASSGGDFAVWDAGSPGRPRRSGWVDDAWTIDDLALAPDGRFVATVDTSGHLRIWDLTTPCASPAVRRWRTK